MSDFKKVIEFFKDISSIPHPSGHTRGVEEYLINFAKSRNLEYKVDKARNIIIYKEGTSSSKEGVILQSHIDMVGVSKDPSVDMTKQKIELVFEGNSLKAKDTSLGADDGIGVAYTLAILDNKKLKHPPIEALFTIDEETGMDGASGLEMNLLKSNRLINIDSEDEGFVLSSCAGGAHFTNDFKISLNSGEREYVEFTISGAVSGHSGQEIVKRSANAIELAFKLINGAYDKFAAILSSIDAGGALNVIPHTAKFTMFSSDCDLLIESVRNNFNEFKKAYKDTDPNLTIRAEKKSGVIDFLACDSMKDWARYTSSLIPHGIVSMSKNDESFVETSLNYGRVYLDKDNKNIHFAISVRSSIDSERDRVLEILKTEAEKYKASKILIDAVYPGWKYAPSKLRDTMKAVFKRMYKKEMVECSVHAGLECGFFAFKRPGLDCASIGPDLKAVHTVEECLDLASAERVFEYVKVLLEEL